MHSFKSLLTVQINKRQHRHRPLKQNSDLCLFSAHKQIVAGSSDLVSLLPAPSCPCVIPRAHELDVPEQEYDWWNRPVYGLGYCIYTWPFLLYPL